MVEGGMLPGGKLDFASIIKLIPPQERLVAFLLVIAFFMLALAGWLGAPALLIGIAALCFGFLLIGGVVVYILRARQRVTEAQDRVRTASAPRPAVPSGDDADDPAETNALKEPSKSKTEVDVFFAAPMDGAQNYDNADVLRILEALRQSKAAEFIYYGGKLINEKAKFDPPHIGYQMSAEALEQAEKFILIWPNRDLSTSALFELGVAKARKLPTTIFCRNTNDLPYLIRGRQDLGSTDDWPVNFYEFSRVQDIVDQIGLQKGDIFPTLDVTGA